MHERNIVWEGTAVYVIQRGSLYAICIQGTTTAMEIGRIAHRDCAIRLARRLDAYPDQAREYAGV